MYERMEPNLKQYCFVNELNAIISTDFWTFVYFIYIFLPCENAKPDKIRELI